LIFYEPFPVGKGFFINKMREPDIYQVRVAKALRDKDWSAAERLLVQQPPSQLSVKELTFLVQRLRQRSEIESAVQVLSKALTSQHTHATTWYMYVDCLLAAKRQGEALDAVKQALAVYPDDPQLKAIGIYCAEQADDYQRSWELVAKLDLNMLRPAERCRTVNSLARSHVHEGRAREAINLLASQEYALPSLEFTRKAALAWSLGRAGYPRQSKRLYKELIVENREKEAPLTWNLSHVELALGEVTNGLKSYEFRFQASAATISPDFESLPVWDGRAELAGKRLWLWREQGLGDEIMFASALGDLRSSGAEVTLECSAKIAPLFRYWFPWARIWPAGQPGVQRDLSAVDYHLPMGSLHARLRPTTEVFMERQRPWIPRNPKAESRARELLLQGSTETLVGLCWRSGLVTKARKRGYLEVQELLGLSSMANVRFVCLQYDDCSEELEELRSQGLPIYHFQDVDQKDQIYRSVNIIGACDLVISVGTSVKQIAWGMGKPVVTFSKQVWNPGCWVADAQTNTQAIEQIVRAWPDIKAWAKAYERQWNLPTLT
jgi:tetratricopeptide (TPR) repeat protein